MCVKKFASACVWYARLCACVLHGYCLCFCMCCVFSRFSIYGRGIQRKNLSFRIVMSGRAGVVRVGVVGVVVGRMYRFTFLSSFSYFFIIQWIASIFDLIVYLIEPHILVVHVMC